MQLIIHFTSATWCFIHLKMSGLWKVLLIRWILSIRWIKHQVAEVKWIITGILNCLVPGVKAMCICSAFFKAKLHQPRVDVWLSVIVMWKNWQLPYSAQLHYGRLLQSMLLLCISDVLFIDLASTHLLWLKERENISATNLTGFS